MLSFLNARQCGSSAGINWTFKPWKELEKNEAPVQNVMGKCSSNKEAENQEDKSQPRPLLDLFLL